jgi:Ca2+-binding RTX toxin-like protein
MMLPSIHANSLRRKHRPPFAFLTCRRTPAARRWAVVAMLAMVLSGNGAPLFMTGQPAVVQAQAPDPTAVGFVLTDGDLRFIFRQIEIAQEHAAGNPLFGPGPLQVNDPRFPHGLRTVDGSLNHLVAGQERWGAADEIFPRLAPPLYRQGEPFDPDGPGPVAAVPTSYLQKRGTVADSQPRIISNLIADQTTRNPAAVAVAGTGAIAEPLGTLPILNTAPDVGLSAPFNSMFTFFGQFFDHGLDLVTKGGPGAVFVPLQADDPLIAGNDGILGNADDLPANLRFMVLTRGQNLPGPDGISGDNPATAVDESADDIREQTNTTTPFVDQNQTYTSHPSHQVFLREYEVTTGRPRPTGRMLDGVDSLTGVPVKNIGSWAEVKNQAATALGIRLVDTDVFNGPLLATDAYGHFTPGPARGLPQFVIQGGGLLEADTAGGGTLIPATAVRTGHAFLDDIAHNAVPNGTPDADNVANPIDVPAAVGQYDDELLDAHFITGDGRGNENIALSAVHTVFHAEHNRLRDYIDNAIHSPAFGLSAAEIAAWEAPHAGSGWTYGERLFQAARFVTEMQYQHLVFEEFARKLVPSINAFVGDGINFHSDFNPAIFAEFAHQTYRLGHSMLTETIGRTAPDGTIYDIPLLEGFLNPLEFNNGPAGRITAAQAAGGIFQGGVAQIGMEIDEFVTEAVRNRLLGLPLDLAVLNLARGRSEGVPPLNAVRMALYLQSGDPQVLPYLDWTDLSFNMKHEESLVNYIAAYGVHPTLQAATTVVAKRTAAVALLGDAAFMFAPAAISGVDRIDLWIGGLGERIAPFGGMLGTTFTAVFEQQLEGLQDGDRFYYLERLDGLNLLAQMEGNSFAELIKRNTTLSGPASDVFSRPGLTFNLTSILRVPGIISDDPTTPDDESTMTDLVLLADGTVRYRGAEHVIWNGSAVADSIVSSEGDDTMTMGDGDDRMEGGAGNDTPNGGAGDDVIIDTFGDDVMKGGPGHDAIHGGSGPFDLLQGNEGNDFILGGNDESEVFGGPGNDMIYMGAGLSESIGGAGDDWMEGTSAPASIAIGDDNDQFQNNPNGGHDILLAGPGDMDFDSEGGDDIMVGNVVPTHRFEGMLGFDWTTYRGETVAVDADMLITGATLVNAPLNEGRDRYDNLEGLSGTNFNDLLRGDDRLEIDLRNDGLTGVVNGHVLNAAGIARIAGLAAILPAGATEFAGGNIILGGGGSDLLEGRAGDDILDGDRWLDVQLSAPRPSTADANDRLLYAGMRVAPQAGCAVGGCTGLDARTLREAVFDRVSRVNPGSIVFVRSIKTTNSATDVDTAVFTGPRVNYAVSVSGTGADRVITVADTVGTDGTDTIRNVEMLQFADQTIVAGGLVGGIPVPNVAGLSQAAAIAAIDVNFTVGTITFQNSRTIPFGIAIGTDPLAGIGATSNSVVNLVMSLGPQIADVHDHTVEAARIALFEVGGLGIVEPITDFVNHSEIPAGIVVTTNPAPGGIVAPGGSVRLIVSLGPAAAGTIPAVAGLLEEDATALIVEAGFNVAANGLRFVTSATVPAGVVISTNPAAGATPALGSNVIVTVSLGAEGLVAAFGFDETTGTVAINSAAPATAGTIRQATRVAGRFGNALSFDGVNDWVSVTDVANSALDLTTGMTLEAWVNPTEMSGWETIMMKERGAGGGGLLAYALYAHDGAAGITGAGARPASYLRANPVASTTDRRVAASTGVLPLNTWTHIASTYDGANFRFYVNGVLVGTTPGSGSINVANGVLRIGGNNSSLNEFFRGLIDEVRVYNRALSATEIATDMSRPVIQP